MKSKRIIMLRERRTIILALIFGNDLDSRVGGSSDYCLLKIGETAVVTISIFISGRNRILPVLNSLNLPESPEVWRSFYFRVDRRSLNALLFTFLPVVKFKSIHGCLRKREIYDDFFVSPPLFAVIPSQNIQIVQSSETLRFAVKSEQIQVRRR
jgi:hypothetical protein